MVRALLVVERPLVPEVVLQVLLEGVLVAAVLADLGLGVLAHRAGLVLHLVVLVAGRPAGRERGKEAISNYKYIQNCSVINMYVFN